MVLLSPKFIDELFTNEVAKFKRGGNNGCGYLDYYD